MGDYILYLMCINEKIGNSVLIKSFNLTSLCSSGKSLKWNWLLNNDIYLALLGDLHFFTLLHALVKVINLSTEQAILNMGLFKGLN